MAKNMIRRPFPRGGIRTRLPVTIYRRSSDEFSPTEIEGLALWLDASSSDLYTTDAGPVTPVASPLDIAGCVGWYDASDSATLFDAQSGGSAVTTNGATVARWQDKSVGNRHLTQSTANTGLPTLTTNALGGRNVVAFGGTGTGAGFTMTNPVSRATHTVIAVYYSEAGGDATGSIINDGGDGYGLSLARGAVTYVEASSGNATVGSGRVQVQLSASGSATIGPAITSWRHAGTPGLFQNGPSIGSGTASGSVSLSRVGYYGVSNAIFRLKGYMAELVIFDTALTTADRARVESYLAAKWSISGVHAPATATSDPVGYWGDKSGNGRHAVQATAGSRPLVGTQNNRKALTFDGSNDNLRHTPSTAIGSTGLTIIAAIKHNLTSQPYYLAPPFSLTEGGAGRPVERWQGGEAQSIVAVANNVSNVGGSYRQQADRLVYALDAAKDFISSGTHQVREFLNGATNFDVSNSGTWATSLQRINVGTRDDGATQYKGDICELCVYDRRLTTAERQRLERYLAARWGITLAPTVSNADAQNWIDRVYQNGGTVSSATAAAVDTFCSAIDSAGIRSKMLRLNLFCGSNLNACLTPLYRSASFGGSPLGNAIDDNQGPFISADFLESTGLNGGASNSSKHLRTGLSPNDIGGANIHLAMFKGAGTIADPGTSRIAMAVFNGTHYYAFQLQNSSGQNNESFAGGLVAATKAAGNTGNSFHICSRTATTGANALVQYINGVSEASNASTVTTPGGASTFYIFGQNNSGSLTTSTMWRLPLFAYSLGIGMSAGDADAYNTAMQSFHAAMGRPV